MNWTDIARLKAAAEQLDAEAESWLQGFAAYINGEWRWNGDYPDQELRVMRLQNSARWMRDIAGKEARRMPSDFQI